MDEKTGHVSTVKVLDRESPLVKNDTYTVILYAVDNGGILTTFTTLLASDASYP